MNGDILARGAKSATFGPAKVSQAKWDSIFKEEEEEPEQVEKSEKVNVKQSKQ